ncbi:ClpP/crotonase-like domain-containing protein [Aspergillus californicus]
MIQLEGPENNNGILWIKLNRPSSGNSLHPTLVRELLSALCTTDTDPAVCIIILIGNSCFFCTGIDLLSKQELSFALGDDFHAVNKILIIIKKILVAAVIPYNLIYIGMVPKAGSSISFSKLISKVLPAKGFLERVTEVAGRLAQAPQGSLVQTKRLLKKTTTKDLLDANDRECRVIVEERIPSGDLRRGREVFQAVQREKERRKSAL